MECCLMTLLETMKNVFYPMAWIAKIENLYKLGKKVLTKDVSVPMECSIMKTLLFVTDFTLVITVLLMKCLVRIHWFSMWQLELAKGKSKLPLRQKYVMERESEN